MEMVEGRKPDDSKKERDRERWTNLSSNRNTGSEQLMTDTRTGARLQLSSFFFFFFSLGLGKIENEKSGRCDDNN
ncbi:uncharacterized protein BO66DRAFT_89062 [Aspergillus aculeatinus CBS 121060]|uniref:Uncharacterized protein n=1 Tax=Aspergillus aculeatinus CBS 121060 TaxID=1448322 RepID=A0ACD1H983_9EURO|nr:hypothetical protein BO66DRAFT_89062 [Aspergillus aculeatinus CBS 121060]RAH70133.1 hypothetical protein BO66DRAFT_89062 [Aspergillus aculeatinus CBS 121060]